MIVKLLTEHHMEFLSLKGGCRGLSESSLVKISNCWKSHAAAQISSEAHLTIFQASLHISQLTLRMLGIFHAKICCCLPSVFQN